MGVDITGWIEVRPIYYDPTPPDDGFSGRWVPVVDNLGFLAGRDYDAFACLFGVQNYANFVPLAASRGLPRDAAETIRQTLAEQEARWDGTADAPFGASWLAWSELAATDWQELAPRADARFHRYRRDAAGHLVYEGKAAWDRPAAEQIFAGHVNESLEAAIRYPGALALPPGQEWEIDGVVYRTERIRREDALTAEWRMIFVMMAALAVQYGADGVRLVVWFNW